MLQINDYSDLIDEIESAQLIDSRRLNVAEAIKSHNTEFNVTINKNLGVIFRALNEMHLKPAFIDEIYESIRGELKWKITEFLLKTLISH